MPLPRWSLWRFSSKPGSTEAYAFAVFCVVAASLVRWAIGFLGEDVFVFAGYYPVEETLGFRLHYQHTRSLEPGVEESVNFIGLQAVFSLGPHKAHPF